MPATDPPAAPIHPWQCHEIILTAQDQCTNPYTEVDCWVDLRGPGFERRVHGFWDGGKTFRVRVVATAPGTWHWTSGSNQPNDRGLNGQTGSFAAAAWSAEELAANPNRRGFLRPSPNRHALQYADGAPCFLLGDTWWAGSTWRYPFKGRPADPDEQPGPGIGFEQAVAFRKRQRFNAIAMIAAFPSWHDDGHGQMPHDRNNVRDSNGIHLRNAWPKSGTKLACDMHDEAGNRPFVFLGRSPSHPDVMPDLDRINPAYFQSLDRKIAYLVEQGFVTFLETVRRDHGPGWKHYHDWPASFARYVQYIVARYGAYNVIFSGVHHDWHHPDFDLDGPTWNAALNHWHATWGPPPFGQPCTALADGSTLTDYGHGEAAPWLNFHGVGNRYRDHRIYPLIEALFALDDPWPALNQEPYYPGWSASKVGDEKPRPGSDRECYFARAMLYGSVLSGGLAGHICGDGSFAGNTTGEAPGDEPFTWEAMGYAFGEQAGHIRELLRCDERGWQQLHPATGSLSPASLRRRDDARLEGAGFLMMNDDRSLAVAYFEVGCPAPTIGGLRPDATYEVRWFDPRRGRWLSPVQRTRPDADGHLALNLTDANEDWAVRISLA